MVKYLLLVAGVSAVLWFAAVVLFFRRLMRLHRRQENVVTKTDAQQLAKELSNKAVQLDELRLWMFLEWLQCHCHGDQTEWVNQDKDELQNFLSRWLEGFSPDDLHAEHELIMTEITWWKTAEEKTLLRCIGKELMTRRLSQ